MGIYEIRTPDQLGLVTSFCSLRIHQNKEGFLEFYAVDAIYFKFNKSIPYINILRKWNKFCMSYDFEKNEAQASINGISSPLYKNPETNPNMKGSFDAKSILEAQFLTELTISVGRYPFDNR